MRCHTDRLMNSNESGGWLAVSRRFPYSLVMSAILSAAACGGDNSESKFGNGSDNVNGSAGTANGTGTGSGTGGGGSALTGGNFINVEAGTEDDDGGGNGASTGCASFSGTVFTPGKTDPLYNA